MAPEQPTQPQHASKAQQTLNRLEEALAQGPNQCLPELMELIQALSTKATEISIEQLADLVEKHIAVMARVISAANTFGYNPTGADITTLRDAIHVIGFERIRSLVTSLILVRHAASPEGMQDQCNTALLAVSSGLLARTLAQERDLADPELAFVSASLRQLGRLMLASYFPDEYRLAIDDAHRRQVSEAQALEEAFGIHPLALTRQLLGKARFPSRVIDTLHEYQPRSTTKRTPEAQAILTLSSFSEKLSQLSMDRSRDDGQFKHGLTELSRTFGNRFGFEEDQLENTLGDVGEKLSLFTQSLGFGSVAQGVIKTLQWRAGRGPSTALPKTAVQTKATNSSEQGAPGPANAAAKPPQSSRPESAPPPQPNQAAISPTATSSTSAAALEINTKHWRDGLVSLTGCLSETTIDMSAVHSLAMDFVRQGFGAPEALVLRIEPDNRNYVATHGVGPVFRRIRSEQAVKRDERTVFGIAISRRENVVIHNTLDPKIAPYLPAWCSSAGGWGAFIAIPVCDQTSCFSLIVIAWPSPCQITIGQENARILRSLLATVGAARRLSSG